jgi:hypothetical protein
MTTHYKARFGAYTASDKVQDGDRLLLSLLVEQAMDGVGGRCSAELAGAEFDSVALGDPVEIQLDAGAGAVTVFTGEVTQGTLTATTQCIEAQDGLARLALQELESAYENVSLDFIIKDLLQQGGAQAGSVCKGPEVPSYAVHRQPRLLGQVWRLAQACGADVYSSGDGKVQVATPGQAGSQQHTLRFGENVRSLALGPAVLPWDSVEVWGEGAGSAKGSAKSHWLCTDLAGVSGKAVVDDAGQVTAGKLGQRPLRLRDGALRSGGAAQDSAKARMAWLAARRVTGQMDLNGAPAVMPGDTVRIDKLPAGHGVARLLADGAPLRVRGVRHWLDRELGLVTRLHF